MNKPPTEINGLLRVTDTRVDMNNQKYKGRGVEVFFQPGTVTAPAHTGSGLNDLSLTDSDYVGQIDKTYTVTVSSVGAVDKFTWSDGGSPSAEIEMLVPPQAITKGLIFNWGATTGHTLGDQWTFTAHYPVGYVQAELRATGLGGDPYHPWSKETKLMLDLNCGAVIIQPWDDVGFIGSISVYPGKKLLLGYATSSGVMAVNGRAGIGVQDPGAQLEVGGAVRITDNVNLPTDGEGLEAFYDPVNGRAKINAYDRGAAAWKEMHINASILKLQNDSGGDVDVGRALIIKSPNNTQWRVTVDNSGVLTTASL